MLSLHIIVAIAHTTRLLLTERSSACWETFEEFVLLAQVSKTDTDDVANCCAGIKISSTMGLNARIRPIPHRAARKGKQEYLQTFISKNHSKLTEVVKEGKPYGRL